MAKSEKRSVFNIDRDKVHGAEKIKGFDAGKHGDVLRLTDSGFDSFKDFQKHLHQQGHDTVVQLGHGRTIVLKGVDASDLTRENLALNIDLPKSHPGKPVHESQGRGVTVSNGTTSGTSGNDSFGAGSNMTYVGGQGDDTYAVNSATQNVVFVEKAGEGIDTVNSWVSYALATDQSIENLTLFGTGNINATGNALDNRITGNSGNNLMTGGAGNDVMTGAGGNDTFVVKPGDGLDVITDFTAAGKDADVINLQRFSFADFAALKAAMTQVGGDTTIWLGSNNSLVLKGVSISDLSAANFQFVDVIATDPVQQKSFNVVGTSGADVLEGASAADTITGGRGNDTMTGDGGRDQFFIADGDGKDTITDFTAGKGGDILNLKGIGFSSFADFQAALKQVGADTVIDLGNGQQVVLQGVKATDLTIANLDLDVDLTPGAAANSWLNPAQAVGNVLTGTAKNDSFGAASNFTYVGGAGDDVYGVSSISGKVTIIEKAGEGIDTVNSWVSFALPTDQSVENLTLFGTGNIKATGNALDNIIIGNTGNNVITGGAGNDLLTGGGGTDTFAVARGDGLDVITDFTATGKDADVIQINDFSYSSFADLKDVMTQAGADTVIWLGKNNTIVLKNVTLGALTAVNFQFVDTPPTEPVVVTLPPAVGPDIIGTSAGETIKGTASAEFIDGRGGNDTLTGGAGSDTFLITKGNGSDTITDFAVGAGGDLLQLQGYGLHDFAAVMAAAKQVGSDTVINLGTETVTLSGVQKSALTAANFNLDYYLAASGAATTNLTALHAGDTLNGTSGNDFLMIQNDAVTLAGGAGDDTYSVAVESTKIIEKDGQGIDTVDVWSGEGYALAKDQSLENLTLMGNANSWGAGNSLANIITGTTGNNILDGRGGNDILVGGGGQDLFIVSKGNGSDVIADFTATGTGADSVSLTGYGFKSFGDIQSAMKQIGSDTVISLGGGETLTLRGVTASTLTSQNFNLPIDTSAMTSTFADDFNSLSLYQNGSGTWQTSMVFGGDSAYYNPGEQQVFVDSSFSGLASSKSSTALGINPFSLNNGVLTINADPISASMQKYMGSQQFTSGMLSSESSFWQTYGYFEISATLPKERGTWPAFWMLPVDKTAPVELDIFESLGDRTDGVHVQTHGSNTSEMNGSWVPTDDIGSKHTYGALWTPYAITFYVDGVEVASYATPEDMNKPMYMIASLGVGGSWGGNADSGTSASATIDYIHAFQLSQYTLAGYTLETSGASTNTISGTSTAENLTGTAGNDLIDSNGGADILTGKLGDDTYIIGNTSAKVVEGFGEGIDTIKSSVTYALGSNVENLTLTGSASINATGNSMSNIITGNSGDNIITGGQGGDVLTGGAGNDTFVMTKGDGSDIITDFQAGAGAGDHVKLLNYAFTSFDEIHDAMTQTGNDVYLKLNAYETLVFRNEKIANFAADDFIIPDLPPTSAASIRWITGTSAAEQLYGTGANETFQGQGGADTLRGGLGDDIYWVDSKATIIEKAGEGVDTAYFYTNGSYTLADNVENLTLGAAATGIGNRLGNLITGSSGADTINGKGGNDWLIGNGGNDTFIYEAGSGRDTIADFHSALGGGTERDHINFTGYDKSATLTHDGDVWTIHYSGGTDTIHIAGVTALSAADYSFL